MDRATKNNLKKEYELALKSLFPMYAPSDDATGLAKPNLGECFVGLKPADNSGSLFNLQVYAPQIIAKMYQNQQYPFYVILGHLRTHTSQEADDAIYVLEICDTEDEIDCIKEDEIINTIGLELPARRPKQGFSIFDMF